MLGFLLGLIKEHDRARMLGLLLGFMPRVKQHKRRLLDRIATRILALEDDGSQARARACWGYC